MHLRMYVCMCVFVDNFNESVDAYVYILYVRTYILTCFCCSVRQSEIAA